MTNPNCCDIIGEYSKEYALVAQLDRAFGYEPKGRGFESRRARHTNKGYPMGILYLYLCAQITPNITIHKNSLYKPLKLCYTELTINPLYNAFHERNKMIFYPQKQPKNASVATLLTILGAATLYFLGDIGIGYRFVFQMSALLLFAVGIFLMTRYILTDYKYIITDLNEHGERYFIIVKVNGKRNFEMAKFDVSELYAYKRTHSVKEFEAENGKADKIFNYLTNFRAPTEMMIAITFNGKKILFRIDAEQELETEIKGFCMMNTKTHM